MGSKRKNRKRKGRRALAVAPITVIRPNVAGIDLASKMHWVAAPPNADGTANVETFGSTTPELERLARWLLGQGVESAAMESTSVYWIPLYELLESRGIEVLLVNARQMHHVPGRKSDMADCQWLQVLHSCGLLKGSFRPGEQVCRLRSVQRERANVTGDRTRLVQRMQKALDQMNVQVHRALSDITGKTGMAIVRAIADGERDPAVLAGLRDPRCKKSEAEIVEHLTGNWRPDHLFNLKRVLEMYDAVQRVLEKYDREILDCLRHIEPSGRGGLEPGPHPTPSKQREMTKCGDQPLRTGLWRAAGVDLTRIDGIGAEAAKVVLSEIGTDLSMFPSEGNFVSWLGLAPNNPSSGGKVLKKKNKGTGAGRAAAVLRMSAVSLKDSKTAAGASYRRLARRKDGSLAVFATARRLAVLIYRMLKYGAEYVDEGAEAYEERFRRKRLKSLEGSASSLGFKLVRV